MQIDIEKQLDQVKEAIIAKVPEIWERHQDRVPGVVMATTPWIQRPITLADVLRAIEKTRNGGDDDFRVKASGVMLSDKLQSFAMWDLNRDLDVQSEDVIAFLHDVLCK